MTCEEFDRLCQSLPHTTSVVQWRGSHVWKVGGKVFAWATSGGATAGVTFKASEMTYHMLKEEPGLRPAPYMASRGLKWLQQHGEPGLPDEVLADYVRHAYAMVVNGLPKKVKTELGLTGRRPTRAGLLEPRARPR